MNKASKVNTRQLTEAGILIAISLILDYVSQFLPLKLWAQGGSINIALVPIVLYSARHCAGKNGVWLSVLMGVISRGLVMLWASGGIYHPLSAVFDYLLIGAAFGLVGLFAKFKQGDFMEWGIIAFGLLALFSHILSGVIVFAEFMPPEYFGMTMSSTWVYSAIYNSTHMVPSIVATVFAYALLPKRLKTAAF